MKQICTLIILSATVLIFISCNKGSNNDNNNITPPVTADSVYLNKIYGIFDTGSGVDTQHITTYNYDALKRLSSGTDVLRSGTGFIPYGTMQAYYSGNDTLPYQIVSYSGNATYTDTLIYFYSYDAAGNKTKDSVISSSLHLGTYSSKITVTNYTYGTDEVYGYTVTNIFYPSPNQVITKDTSILDANKNIITNVKYNVLGPIEALAVTSNFTWDSFHGAYSKVNTLKAMFQFPLPTNILNISNNNPFTQHHNQLLPTPENNNSSITYEYNSNGYPYIADMDYNGVVYKYVYTYISI